MVLIAVPPAIARTQVFISRIRRFAFWSLHRNRHLGWVARCLETGGKKDWVWKSLDRDKRFLIKYYRNLNVVKYTLPLFKWTKNDWGNMLYGHTKNRKLNWPLEADKGRLQPINLLFHKHSLSSKNYKSSERKYLERLNINIQSSKWIQARLDLPAAKRSSHFFWSWNRNINLSFLHAIVPPKTTPYLIRILPATLQSWKDIALSHHHVQNRSTQNMGQWSRIWKKVWRKGTLLNGKDKTMTMKLWMKSRELSEACPFPHLPGNLVHQCSTMTTSKIF